MTELDDLQTRRNEQNNRRRAVTNRRRTMFGGMARWKRRLLLFSIWLGIGAVLAAIAGWFAFDLFTRPYKTWAQEFNLEDINNLNHPSIIYDRNGKEIGRIFDENRSYVHYSRDPEKSEVSENMVNALLAQEDSRFWDHNGYDSYGILRAAKEAVMAGGKANQGASTITQQLARTAFDLKRRALARGEKSIGRKIVEIYLAMRIEERFSKEQILEFYLNRVYLGSGYYGIRAASLGYFGKEPKDLTVREAASIAALIKYPNGLSPLKNIEGNKKWRNDVLDRMVRSKYLERNEAERLKKLPVELNPKPLSRGSSHIHNFIDTQTGELFGEDLVRSRGLRIYTTLDKDIQEASGQALQAQLDAIEKRPDYNNPLMKDYKVGSGDKPLYLDGALMVVNNATGAILAYHGGRDFSKRQFDVIQAGARPPGTTMLPMLYATAFENGVNPTTVLIDDAIDNRRSGIGGSEGILGEWGMETERGRYEDAVTSRRALAYSKIAASLDLVKRLDAAKGSKPFIKLLERMGIRPPAREPGSTEANPFYYPRVYVGTEPVSLKEMVLAYTAFPNLGKRPRETYIITKITDANGKILWTSPQAQGDLHTVDVMSPIAAYQVHSIMQESLHKGSAQRALSFLPEGFKGAVKTGTNYDFSDNWLFGYNANITCGVWIGFVESKKPIYPNAFSSDTCAPILGSVFENAAKSIQDTAVPMPPSVEEIEICSVSGKKATMFCYETERTSVGDRYTRCTYKEYMPKGDTSLGSCTVHGDEGISMNDFFPSPGNAQQSARILPVKPILPTAPDLIGDDPYGSILQKNPRFKNASGIENVSLGHDILDAAEVPDDDPSPAAGNDSTLTIPAPESIKIPVPELQLR